jgi:putative ABC transport system ATP-binding protein
MALLEVQELKRGFGSKTFNTRLEVLKGVNLEIKQGELVALMGPSGCGKSTLLNIIGGLLRGDSGEITINSGENNYNYGTKNPSRVVNVRREGVGWIFQDFHLIEHLTAIDNVALSLEISGLTETEAEEKARVALTKVGLKDRMDFGVEQLSGGQRQRVAVARAIAGSRPLLLADEPTGNLDIESGNDVIKLFQMLTKAEKPISVLMVTHDPNLASQADRMLLLKDGIVAASDIKSAWGIKEDRK